MVSFNVIAQCNDKNIRTTSCKKEHIYTAVISERSDNNIRTTSCKIEHIYTAVISKRNDKNIRTTSTTSRGKDGSLSSNSNLAITMNNFKS
jgi:hypothetical protein